jgi:signal peptidase I
MTENDDWPRPLGSTPRERPPEELEQSPDGSGRTRQDSWASPVWHPAAPPAPPPPRERVEPEGTGEDEEGFHHPLDRVTGRLPKRLRIVVDWVVTIVGAVAIVLAIKAWVVNPYRIPSSSMEPTLHCARPATGCEARFSDRVLANRFIYHFRDPKRGEIVVFKTTPAVFRKCNAGGTFVKRIVGLPGETVELRVIRGREYTYINGRKLEEPYVRPDRRGFGPEKKYNVPEGQYFLMGDNRASSCDSRQWGGMPRDNILGKVFLTYWPPQRISFR